MDLPTIAQIATPNGLGGISIIKISGSEAFSICQKIFKKAKKNQEITTHHLYYGHIYEEEIKIDEVLVAFMEGPQTATGEDVVEINCHGGILITNKIFELVLKNGATAAIAGEFIQRSFLNGKKSLEEVETILDLTSAKTEDALSIAINNLNSSTTVLIEALRQKLLTIVTNVEVNIEYPEYEDLKVVKNEDIKVNIDELILDIDHIIKDSKRGEIIKEGIRTALIGAPNVGKSSILNYLSKAEKAIVTDIAGTTRDTNEAQINLGKITLNLIDTAGIRKTSDVIEKLGVEKSLEQIEKAEFILLVLDGSRKQTVEELELLTMLQQKPKPHLVIVNKLDDQKESLDIDLKEQYVPMAALYQTGEDQLVEKLEEYFDLKNFEPQNKQYIVQIETRIKLETVMEKLIEIKRLLEEDFYLDLILIDLKETLFILGDLLGLNVQDDYLNEMFSRFCLGK